MNTAIHTSDVIVIGGGNIGSATAYGLAERGLKVVMLDEGDMALRSAHGNFGLVWYQGKGRGMPRYVEWSLEATRKWPRFAEVLVHTTGVQIGRPTPSERGQCPRHAASAEREQHFEESRRQSWVQAPYWECGPAIHHVRSVRNRKFPIWIAGEFPQNAVRVPHRLLDCDRAKIRRAYDTRYVRRWCAPAPRQSGAIFG